MAKFELPELFRRRLIAAARAGSPKEICGLIGGHGHKASSIYPSLNISETPEIAYFIDPKSQIDAMRMMRHCSEMLIGIYHSHPRGAAVPSARDLREAAYPGVYYLIISLQETGDVRAYHYDGGAFAGCELKII